MPQSLLTPEEEAILHEERRLLVSLQRPLALLEASDEDTGLLERALLQLDELFLLVVAGEFNAGKSAFINALLGKRFLEEGVTPTTTAIHILKYGPVAGRGEPRGDLAVLTFPVEWLREVNIVDTPGTNAVMQRHQEIAEEFVPRADLVLFVTSADRPFSESERQFLSRIRAWGKKVVVIVNKIDILESEADLSSVIDFVERNARELLGARVNVFPIAARQARQAKESPEGQASPLWRSSRFGELEVFLFRTLNERERVRLKLASGLGVAQQLGSRYLQLAAARRSLLGEDLSTVGNIELQLITHEEDLRREFKYHLSHVDNVLYAMADRGAQFFDDTIKLTRIRDLISADRMRLLFETQVMADTSAQVDAHVQEMIDWLVEQDYRQWQSVMDTLGKRMAHHQDRIVGQVGGQFEYNRQALLASVGKAARETVATYDHQGEARKLAESVQAAVAQTALVQAGAIGLGALLVKVLATAMADVSGLLAAGALAAFGFYLIPNRRRRAKNELQAKISELRSNLSAALTTQFEHELNRSTKRVREAMSPYTRFVEKQQQSLGQIDSNLRSGLNDVESLLSRVDALETEGQAAAPPPAME